MPKLIAKEKFFYAGRDREAGEEFEAEQQDVALLTNSPSPKASLPPTADSAAAGGLFERKDEQPSPDATTQTGRGRYKRRDMRAKE